MQVCKMFVFVVQVQVMEDAAAEEQLKNAMDAAGRCRYAQQFLPFTCLTVLRVTSERRPYVSLSASHFETVRAGTDGGGLVWHLSSQYSGGIA